MSCGGAGKEPNDLITFGTALRHCFTTTSYVIWLVFATIIIAADVYFSLKSYKNGNIDGKGFAWRILIGLAFFLACFLARPAEIAQNTTVDQAARGIWIGY